MRNGYGTIGFAVGTSTQCSLAGVPNATQISFEYDIAYGNDSGNSGVISAFMNGAYIGSGSNYSTYGLSLIHIYTVAFGAVSEADVLLISTLT